MACNSCVSEAQATKVDPRWRRALWIALTVNAAMFAIEMAAGITGGSKALQADALDFFGDAANYAISLGVAGMALAAGLFVLAGWVGALIPRNADVPPPADGVQIMVETNGVHTAIVMPVVTQDVDWRQVFPSAAWSQNGELPTHVSVGWGEREVFMNTPTWGDLRAGTALRVGACDAGARAALDRFVAELIASGQYQNASEVVRAGLRLPARRGTLPSKQEVNQERSLT